MSQDGDSEIGDKFISRLREQQKGKIKMKAINSKTLKEIDSMIENFGSSNPTYWGCAIGGEVGEAQNLLKKLERDGVHKATKSNIAQVSEQDAWRKFKELLGSELADIFIYNILIAREYGIDLEGAILKKLKVVDKRVQEGSILKD